MELKGVLLAMNLEDPQQWTREGAPKLEYLQSQVGRPVTRKEVEEAWPGFTRKTLMEPPVEAMPPDPDPEPEVAKPDEHYEYIGGLAVPVKDPEIMAADFNEVINDLDLLERALEEIDRQSRGMMTARNAVNAKLKDLGARSLVLSAAKLRLEKRLPNQDGKMRKAYLARQHEMRAKKALAAKQFLTAGTNAHDLRTALDPRAKIDAALNQRRSGYGGQRPVFPNPKR